MLSPSSASRSRLALSKFIKAEFDANYAKPNLDEDRGYADPKYELFPPNNSATSLFD